MAVAQVFETLLWATFCQSLMDFDNPDSPTSLNAGFFGCISGLFSVRPVYLNNEDP